MALVACSAPAEQEEAAVDDVESQTEMEEQVEVGEERPLIEEVVQRISQDINMDGAEDEIVLTGPVVNDPGIFTEFKVSFAGGGELKLTNDDAWDTISMEYLMGWENRLPSDLIYQVRTGDNNFLFLKGYPYGCCPEKLTIIDARGESPRRLWHKDIYLWEVLDLDDDGLFEMVGRHSAVEVYDKIDSLKVEVAGYAPFSVYRMGEEITLDSSQTAGYNRLNYLWLGFEVDEEVKILHPVEGGNPYVLVE
jgi:hypothetical protein